MSDSDEEAGSSSIVPDGNFSPISAADMLNRSLRRTPRRTPTRKLFPDNIDQVAPGMTPTSRSRPKRKSTAAAKTPRKSSSRVIASSAVRQPIQTPPQDVFSEGMRSPNRMQSEREAATSRATPGNRSILRSDVSVTRGKRKASGSEGEESTSMIANQFDGWGRGREESPMELLRRLVRAPGRLQSPTEAGDSTMQSISQVLESSERELHPSALVPAPKHLTRDVPPPSSRPSSSNHRDRVTASRFSMAANTSIAASEAGQGRRAARQSQVTNLFSDVLDRDTSFTQSVGQTTGKRSDFPHPEGISELQERNDVETALGQDSRGDSTILEGAADTTAAASIKRFEDIETSIASTRSQLFNDEDSRAGIEEEELDESDVFRTRNLLAQSPGGQDEPHMQDDADGYGYDEDPQLLPNESHSANGDRTSEGEDENHSDQRNFQQDVNFTESSDEEEDEIVDQSKELQHARLALLRKRRSKKKAKRYSSISGNVVPCLPSSTVKGLFLSSVTPQVGLGVAQQSKGKIVVDKGAAEAVEDLTHHFFAQFMQSLVSQADAKSQSNISERDILALLKSQGQISARNSLSFLARKHLPKELSDLVTSTTAVSEAASARKQKGRRQKSVAIVEDSRISESEDDAEEA